MGKVAQAAEPELVSLGLEAENIFCCGFLLTLARVVVLAATPISEVKGEGYINPKRLSWPGHKAKQAGEKGFVSLATWHFGGDICGTHTWGAQHQVWVFSEILRIFLKSALGLWD